MRDPTTFRRAIISSITMALVLVGTALVANAQNTSEEYREWQRAQQRAQMEYQQYVMTRSMRDYRQWQNAQRQAQQEYAEYQQASRFGGNYNRYDNRDNRYDNRYGTNTGQYRVYRDGSYYMTNQRGVELLRQAVRSGYSQGYRQGQMDRQYGRRYDYDDDNYYRSGTYGYQSYVDRSQYQHYFQQGYQRGYEDGYRSTNRYGSGANILGGILNTILRLADDN